MEPPVSSGTAPAATSAGSGPVFGHEPRGVRPFLYAGFLCFGLAVMCIVVGLVEAPDPVPLVGAAVLFLVGAALVIKGARRSQALILRQMGWPPDRSSAPPGVTVGRSAHEPSGRFDVGADAWIRLGLYLSCGAIVNFALLVVFWVTAQQLRTSGPLGLIAGGAVGFIGACACFVYAPVRISQEVTRRSRVRNRRVTGALASGAALIAGALFAGVVHADAANTGHPPVPPLWVTLASMLTASVVSYLLASHSPMFPFFCEPCGKPGRTWQSRFSLGCASQLVDALVTKCFDRLATQRQERNGDVTLRVEKCPSCGSAVACVVNSRVPRSVQILSRALSAAEARALDPMRASSISEQVSASRCASAPGPESSCQPLGTCDADHRPSTV